MTKTSLFQLLGVENLLFYGRLAFQSQIILELFKNKTLSAPVVLKNGDSILDSGAGSGMITFFPLEQRTLKIDYQDTGSFPVPRTFQRLSISME